MKINIKLVAVAVVVGGVAFFGGMKYGQSSAVASRGGNSALRAQFGQNAAGTRTGTQFNGTFGEVTAKSDNSITIKLADGSSRIVFVSKTTPVEKSTTGSPVDVIVGQNISVTGTTNADGSVTAQDIQIRPNRLPGQSVSPSPSK